MGPSLRVVILDAHGDVLLELGYYDDETLTLEGATGRYWDPERDLFYGSSYELPR